MGREPKITTDRERAALAALVLGIVDNWPDCYAIATDRSRAEFDRLADKNAPVSRWKNAARIVKAYKDMQNLIADQRAAARAEGYQKGVQETRQKVDEEGRSNGVSADGQPAKTLALVDYSDPNNRKRLYNEVIRDAKSDPKTRLDAAKVFEQIQRDDKQAAREQKQVRAYLPLNCSDCPLYQKAREKR